MYRFGPQTRGLGAQSYQTAQCGMLLTEHTCSAGQQHHSVHCASDGDRMEQIPQIRRANRYTFTPLIQIVSITCDYCHVSHISFAESGRRPFYGVPSLSHRSATDYEASIDLNQSEPPRLSDNTRLLCASHAVSTLLLHIMRLTISMKAMFVPHALSRKTSRYFGSTPLTASVAPGCLQATNINHAPHLLSACIHADSSTTWL
jgi:hypothetical protein